MGGIFIKKRGIKSPLLLFEEAELDDAGGEFVGIRLF